MNNTSHGKRLLMLGGSKFIIPAIEAAHKIGCYVITCDYLPDNIAHKYSDEYHNVSTTDFEGVLKLAQELDVDGILSFATDSGAITASLVAEHLGLPGSPSESVKILQNKDLFRKYLHDNGFNVPKAKSYSTYEEAKADIDYFTYPVIVKPVDSAGSKGVSRLDSPKNLEEAVEYALTYSLSKKIIIEEFITQMGFSSDSDCFSIDSELVFCSFNNQYFDADAENPYTPSAYSWPSLMSEENQKELRSELQRLIRLLNMGTAIYNVETRVGIDGNAYIMEVSPRAGGNRLSEMLRISSGQDLITNSVRAALGEQLEKLHDPTYDGWYAEYILHADNSGFFSGLNIDEDFYSSFVVESDLWVEIGDKVNAFTGGNNAIGTLILRFSTQEELISSMKNIKNNVEIVTTNNV